MEDDIQEKFGDFPQHVEFVRMLQEKQCLADKKQEKVPYEWRGYKSSVFPNLPTFQLDQLNNRLIMALRGVFNISPNERKVFIFVQRNFFKI